MQAIIPAFLASIRGSAETFDYMYELVRDFGYSELVPVSDTLSWYGQLRPPIVESVGDRGETVFLELDTAPSTLRVTPIVYFFAWRSTNSYSILCDDGTPFRDFTIEQNRELPNETIRIGGYTEGRMFNFLAHSNNHVRINVDISNIDSSFFVYSNSQSHMPEFYVYFLMTILDDDENGIVETPRYLDALNQGHRAAIHLHTSLDVIPADQYIHIVSMAESRGAQFVSRTRSTDFSKGGTIFTNCDLAMFPDIQISLYHDLPDRLYGEPLPKALDIVVTASDYVSMIDFHGHESACMARIVPFDPTMELDSVFTSFFGMNMFQTMQGVFEVGNQTTPSRIGFLEPQ